MTVSVCILDESSEQDYQQLLASSRKSLLYQSLPYRNFLKQVLPDAEDRYLLAYRGDRLEAALPAFIKRAELGAVVNSLPFYGSNGGLVTVEDYGADTIDKLLEAFDDLCHKEQAVTSTIITNPLIGDHHFENYPRDMTEERIGQFTALPQGLSGAELENHLMQSIHVKTRNLVRKGFKSGFDIREDDSEAAMRTLAAVHWDNMAKIGGTHKPWKIFQSIRDNFHYGNEYRVYTASRDGEVAAALLVFFCNETAEYFTPVIRPKYRSDQPLSALIFTAMLDSVSLGCRQWNWGGTWLNQDGVYHFKSRWGTRDIHYRYLVRAYLGIEQIKTSNRSEIQCMYPYFYVLPYPELEGANDEL